MEDLINVPDRDEDDKFALIEVDPGPSQVDAFACKEHEEVIDETVMNSCLRVGEKPDAHVTAKIADDSTKFEETTLLSSKCCKVDIHLGEREGLCHLFTVILHNAARRNIVRKEAAPTSLVVEMKRFHTSLKPTWYTTFLSRALFVCALI